jgi:hypothetical protein
MKKFAAASAGIIFMLSGCFSIPHLIVPQKDIEAFELNEASLESKVLIASRTSEFKEGVLEKIREEYAGRPVYIQGLGLTQLTQEKASDYSAVVLLNKCMSWDMDRNVKKFLKRNPGSANVVVFTTSATGEWAPKKRGRSFDAISAASETSALDKAAEEIISKIDSLL